MFEQAAVSDLADEYKIQPSQLYHWHKQVQDNLEAAFAGDRGKRATQHQQAQEAKLARRGPSECSRHVLLSLLPFGRLQPGNRALGAPRGHDRAGRRNHCATCPRDLSRCQAAHHLGQRASVCRSRFQDGKQQRSLYHRRRSSTASSAWRRRDHSQLGGDDRSMCHRDGRQGDPHSCPTPTTTSATLDMATRSVLRGALLHLLLSVCPTLPPNEPLIAAWPPDVGSAPVAEWAQDWLGRSAITENVADLMKRTQRLSVMVFDLHVGLPYRSMATSALALLYLLQKEIKEDQSRSFIAIDTCKEHTKFVEAWRDLPKGKNTTVHSAIGDERLELILPDTKEKRHFQLSLLLPDDPIEIK